MPKTEMPILKFIRDVPATTDAFGHSRVASAVATAIHTQNDLKVIGLLGVWGSGKSTVVKLVQAELEKAEGIATYVFTYDAWLHQSDPPRRSFLETLIKYLLSKNTGLSRDKWQARLDELNRRVEESDTTTTPTLTTSGRVALVFLLLLPVGMQLVGHDWVKDALATDGSIYVRAAVIAGTAFLFLPFLLASFLYLKWRPRRWPFKLSWWPFSGEFFSCANWRTHRSPHENDSIISLVMNKAVNRVRNKITRSPDPTAIEFQNAFREIMKEVSKDGRRFIFVIDNLDRLPEAQAVAMWGTIRSFFLGAADTEENGKQSYLPTVILPVDETAVARMYDGRTIQEHDGIAGSADLARSFMEKTFDLTFRVTRPVLSNWKGYLDQQMKYVFGEYLQDDWSYITGLFLEKAHSNALAPQITPRIINAHINRIGTLWLQWRDEDISFASIAYYAIFFGDGEPDIHQQVALPQASIATLDANWQRAIAAMYYGCNPDAAMQILIEQRLRTAVAERNQQEFKLLAAMPGFDAVLQRVFDLAASGDIADPVFVLNAVALLDTLNPPDRSWVRYAWRALRLSFEKPTSWQKLREDDAPSFAALMKHCNGHEGQAMLDALARKLANILEAVTVLPGFEKNFASICIAASDRANAVGLKLPDIVVPGAQGLFLNILSACANDNNLLSALKTKIPDADVVAELSGNLADPTTTSQVVLKVRALMNRKPSVSWDAFVAAAGQIIQDQDVGFAGMNSAIESLGLLRLSVAAAEARIKDLANTGSLTKQFHNAHTSMNLEVEARVVALLLLATETFESPGGQSWQALLDDRPTLVGLIDRALLEFDTSNRIATLIKHFATNPNTDGLISAIVSLRIREDRMGLLDIGQVIAELPQYLKCIEGDLQDQFIRKMSGYNSFWEKIDAAALDANAIHVLGELIKSGSGQEDKAREILEKKLKQVSTEGWTSVLNSGGEPLPIAMSLSDVTGKALHLTTDMYRALETAIAPLLANDSHDFRRRWFNLLDLVTPSSRVTLLKTVRDDIARGTIVAGLPAFLLKGGDGLLSDGAFVEVADGAVRYVIWRLLDEADGISWLSDEAARLQPWIARSDEATRNVTVERLSERWRTADAVTREQLIKLSNEWNLPMLTVEESDAKENGADVSEG